MVLILIVTIESILCFFGRMIFINGEDDTSYNDTNFCHFYDNNIYHNIDARDYNYLENNDNPSNNVMIITRNILMIILIMIGVVKAMKYDDNYCEINNCSKNNQ